MNNNQDNFNCPECGKKTATTGVGGTILSDHKRSYDMDVSHNYCTECGNDWWD